MKRGPAIAEWMLSDGDLRRGRNSRGCTCLSLCPCIRLSPLTSTPLSRLSSLSPPSPALSLVTMSWQGKTSFPSFTGPAILVVPSSIPPFTNLPQMHSVRRYQPRWQREGPKGCDCWPCWWGLGIFCGVHGTYRHFARDRARNSCTISFLSTLSAGSQTSFAYPATANRYSVYPYYLHFVSINAVVAFDRRATEGRERFQQA